MSFPLTLRAFLAGAGTVFAFFVAFHFFSVTWVRHFYSLNIPHYDSIGTLTFAYRILSAYNAGGYVGASEFLAAQPALTPLSLSQAWFVALFAPVLEARPDSIQLYNSLCVAAALSGMFVFARGVGASHLGAALFAATLFLPDGLWWWDFGLLDYRRDAGMFCLLTTSLFLLLALYLGAFGPRQRLSLALATGFACGLTLLSRDSAAPYFFGFVALPAAGLALVHAGRSGVATALGRIALIAVAGSPFLAVWIAWSPGILGRLSDPLLAFGAGDDGWRSLGANAETSLRLLVGDRGSHTAGMHSPIARAAAGLAIASVVAAIVFRRTPRQPPQLPFSSARTAAILLIVAVWISLFLQIFLAFYVGWRVSLPFVTRAPPLMPGIIAVYLLAAAALFWLRRWNWPRAALIGLLISIGPWVHGAVTAKMRETPPEVLRANETVASLSAGMIWGPLFADLWLEVVRVPFLAYQAAQRGVEAPRRVNFTYQGGTYDSVVAAPADPRVAADLLGRLEEGVRCWADFIIVTTELNQYSNPASPLLLFRSGRPMIERLLADLADRRIATMHVPHNSPVVLIDNRGTPTCPRVN